MIFADMSVLRLVYGEGTKHDIEEEEDLITVVTGSRRQGCVADWIFIILFTNVNNLLCTVQ